MNQIENNPFPFSDTNKRYHTFSYAMKKQYGQKVAKIPLNAGFTCPNRDGSKAYGGCRFCSSQGSGDSIEAFSQDLRTQFEANKVRAQKKWPGCLAMPYFQAYSNTYAPLDVLQEIYSPFLNDPNIFALAIATRADCLDQDFCVWLSQFDQDIWIEFGLQTIHSDTAQAMNMCSSPEDLEAALRLCRNYGLKTCIHIINGLPGESRQQMMETAAWAAKVHPDAIKLHMLHLLENSALGQQWKQQPFDLMSREEYVSLIADQLELFPPDVIIERISGDGLAADLLAPAWTKDKTVVANEIDKYMAAHDYFQGRLWFDWQGQRSDQAYDKDGFHYEWFHEVPYEAMRLRMDIFVKEQGFVDEADEQDHFSQHLVLFKDGKALGTLRVYEDRPGIWAVGRVAVAKDERGKYIGERMIDAAAEYLEWKGAKVLILHSQQQAIGFYAKCGFEPFGPMDEDQGVPHQWMKMEIEQPV